MTDPVMWRAWFSRLAAQAARPRGTAAVWILLAGLYLLTAGWGSLSADVVATYLPGWALGQHHNANVDGYQNTTLWLHQIGHHWRSDRFPGAILLTVPAYALFGHDSHVTVFPALLTAALAAATTVALMHRTLLRITTPGLALAGAAVLAVGTPTWSVSADAPWTHTATQLGLALMLYGLAAERRWLGALGMTLAAAARPHTAVVAAVIGIGDVVRNRRLGVAVWLAAGSLAGFAVVLVWSGLTLDHASLFPGTYSGRGADAAMGASTHSYGWPLNIAGFLVSPERGLLVMCPFIVPCLFGVRRAWRTAPSWVRDAGIAAVVYSLVQLGVNNFAGGWGFYSFRLAIEPLTLAAPLLVLAAAQVWRRGRAWACALTVLVGWSIATHTMGSSWYVNTNEGKVWWTRYQPAQMAIDIPWHAVLALLIGAAVTAVLVGLVRSDPSRPQHPADAVPARPDPASVLMPRHGATPHRGSSASGAAARSGLAERTVAYVSAPRGAWPMFAAFALLFVATASYWRTSIDIRGTFVPAWELGQHHTINSDGYLKTASSLRDVGGHLRSDRYPGAILLGVPAYAVVALFGGTSDPAIGPSSVTAALMAALAVVLFHRTLLRLVAPGLALGATLVFALGTATWAVSGDALWTHTSTQLGICMALYGIAANRAWWPLFGMMLAAAARPHIAVVALTLAVGLVLNERRRLVPLALVAGAGLGWAVILVWTRITFGQATLLPGSYNGRGNDVTKANGVAADGGNVLHGWPENIAGFLVSPERGVLVLTPVLLLCLFGLRRAWPHAPAWTKWAALAALGYTFVQLAGNYFAGGASFYSYRLAIEGVTLLAPLAVLCMRALLPRAIWRRSAFVLIAYGFVVTAIGAIWYRPLYDTFRPWHYYRPTMLAAADPWHGVAAVVIGVALAAAVTAFVRCDPAGAPVPRSGDTSDDSSDDADDDGPDDTGDGPRPPGDQDPGGVAVYRGGRRVNAR